MMINGFDSKEYYMDLKFVLFIIHSLKQIIFKTSLILVYIKLMIMALMHFELF